MVYRAPRNALLIAREGDLQTVTRRANSKCRIPTRNECRDTTPDDAMLNNCVWKACRETLTHEYLVFSQGNARDGQLPRLSSPDWNAMCNNRRQAPLSLCKKVSSEEKTVLCGVRILDLAWGRV